MERGRSGAVIRTSVQSAAACRESAEHAFAARMSWSIHEVGFDFPSK